ncbi:MAG: hypothetical protein IT424_12685 [Pirellulales bacterium]|nr:hypothetical protein [Pirellulales bacterium]
MATDALAARGAAVESEPFDYKPLSTTAVASLVFGLLSTAIFLSGGNFEDALSLSPLALLGLALGCRSLSVMRASPDQFSGGGLAKAGTALSAVCLAGGLAFSGYLHATEVPEGYVRTSFIDLRPDEVDLRGDHFIPPEAAKLDGQKVFIKGYMRPGSHYSDGGSAVANGIRTFLLVRDNAQCCFGDLSSVKYFDQVAVAMATNQRLSYSPGLYRMGGTLRIFSQNAGDTSRGPTYVLEADYAK